MKTAKQFYEFFKKIPANKWTECTYSHEGQYCALGHLGETYKKRTKASIRFNTLIHNRLQVWPAAINDSEFFHPFHQKTPKGRILAALRAIIKKGKK